MLRILPVLSLLVACNLQSAPSPTPASDGAGDEGAAPADEAPAQDASPGAAADAPIDPAQVTTLLSAEDGQPLVGERELDECSSQLLVRDGGEWTVLTPLGGSATVVRKGDTLAGYSSCSEHLGEVFVDAKVFSTGLPEFPRAIRFLDGNRISLTGFELQDPTLTEVLFVRDGQSWKQSDTNTCKPFDAKALGNTLLATDLNGDEAEDYVIELADSCGTGGCTTEVYLTCAQDGTARRVSSIPQWNGVELGPETHGGHRDLVTKVKVDGAEKEQVLRWTDQGYQRVE